MAKRIVEELTINGNVIYRVEHNEGLFGLRKHLDIWVTCSYKFEGEEFDAVFRSKSEAEKFCIDIDDHVISRQVVKIYD